MTDSPKRVKLLPSKNTKKNLELSWKKQDKYIDHLERKMQEETRKSEEIARKSEEMARKLEEMARKLEEMADKSAVSENAAELDEGEEDEPQVIPASENDEESPGPTQILENKEIEDDDEAENNGYQSDEDMFMNTPEKQQPKRIRRYLVSPPRPNYNRLDEKELRKINIAVSGLSSHDKVKDFVLKFKLKSSKNVTENATHLIVRTDEQNIAAMTLKFFQAVTRKIWIVGMSWVNECLEKGFVVTPNKHEVKTSSGIPGKFVEHIFTNNRIFLAFTLLFTMLCKIAKSRVRFHSSLDFKKHSYFPTCSISLSISICVCISGPTKARLSDPQHMLFDGFEFHFDGNFSDMAKDDLIYLVTKCGGKVSRSVHSFSVSKICLVVMEKKSLAMSAQADRNFKLLKIVTVNSDWIRDSIHGYGLKEVQDYLVHDIQPSEMHILEGYNEKMNI